MTRGAAERFLTTVLMTDIVGSTEHVAELGDRGWRDLVQLHHGLVRAALRRHVGREVDTAGDGFFAVFDAPAAALACALDVCGDVRELGIEVRAGLHVGEVEQIAGKVGGITVPIAARIMATAGPSEVVVSGTVRDLAAGAGFRFEDLGLRELKGVPGEWRIFRVARAADDEKAATVVRASQRGDARPTRRRRVIGPGREARMVGPEPLVDPASRRAAAVRRVRSRPVWVRHRWLTAAGTVVFAGAIAGAGLLAWSPWRAPALTGVSEDSVGIVDAGRNEVVHQIEVGARPVGIAHGEGSVWVSNSGSDNVSRIDPTTRSVIDTIDVGEAPSGIAVAGGSVWVSNSGSRSVSRINAATGRVVDTIAVGNLPGAIAHGGGAIWVANTGDGTVTRIDPTSGAPGDPIAVGLAPSAIAADEAGVWVASRESAVVTRLDPRTGVASAAPIGVGSRPVALAIAGGSVWIANAGDDSVTRADIATDRVTATADVGGSPLSVAAGPAAIWVAVQEGAIHRIDPDDPNAPALRIPVGAAPQAVTLVDGAPWFLTHAAAGSHRGGTLRVVAGAGYSIDPAHFPVPELRSLFGDGLVGYRRQGGISGSTLMPDLATSIPRPTEGGRVYTFTLRSGLVYADGTPVRPDDFRRAIERAIQVEDGDFGARGAFLFATIEGAAACIDGTVSPCDLSAGIVTDTVANTVSFRLTEPDADFLAKLALDPAFPIPEGAVPMDDFSETHFPATGPYMVASASESEIRLVRNPNFRSWDPDVRPDAFADEIVWTLGVDPVDQVAMVRRGEADHMAGFVPPEAFAGLRTQYPRQLQLATQATTFVFMNTRIPPFDRLEVRQAVNLAVDRAHVAELRGGPFAASVTCQVLPPNFPAYQPYCPWTVDPDPGQRWKGLDLAAARRLVAASGTAGMEVAVGPFIRRLRDVGVHIVTVLDDLGYEATLVTVEDDQAVYAKTFEDGTVGIGGFSYLQEFPAPGTFLDGFTCEGSDGLSNFCDAEVDALVDEARRLQVLDPVQAAASWAALDRRVVDLGLWAPLVNEGTQFVSERLGNYQFHPQWGILLDQAWVE